MALRSPGVLRRWFGVDSSCAKLTLLVFQYQYSHMEISEEIHWLWEAKRKLVCVVSRLELM